MFPSGKHASFPTFLSVLQASISFILKRIKLISENTENLFFVLLPVK